MFNRIQLANLPTPIDEAPRLAGEIGLTRLFVKRDDNTGLALGGNKARKLEFLMADARAKGADVVLTCGGVQSNHARMTAAAARKAGMDCILFMPDPKPESITGNVLLDTILGARLLFLPGIKFDELQRVMDAEAARLIEQGRTPYVIPMGGSTPLGALGYVQAVREAAEQLNALGVDSADMVTAVGTSGTLAGITLGSYLFMPESRPVGISVLFRSDRARDTAVDLANRLAVDINIGHEPDIGRMVVYDEYVGEGYAIPTEGCIDAILLAARTEGLILDPVYTGKAMHGLIDLARKGEIGKDRPVLFWHTGGAPGLLASGELFREEAERLIRDA